MTKDKPALTPQPDLSVIVPFYNEEDNIQRMHAAVVAAVEPLGIPFEMVFVSDGRRYPIDGSTACVVTASPINFCGLWPSMHSPQ